MPVAKDAALPLFTFYLARANGASTALEAHELDDDDQALARGRDILGDHASAAEVAIWQGERQVGLIRRAQQAGG